MSPLQRRTLILFAALVVAFCVGVAGFYFIGGYTLINAVYMTAMTMTTVGYGEVQPLSPAARVFNSFYLVLSAGLLFLAIGVMTQAVIEAQFGNYLGRRRLRRMLDNLQGHYIVCGFGRVGRGAALELQQSGVTPVIIDRREDRVEWAMRLGYIAVLGDSTRDETLKEVRIDRASGLIAALATDADNLFAVISARTLNSKLRIGARAAEDEAERKMRQVGANSVFAPYTMTGTRLAQSLLKPHVHQFLDFASMEISDSVRIEQVEVLPASDMPGKSLAELRIRSELKVIVLGIRRPTGRMVFNPSADEPVQGGDYLIVMGELDALRRLEARAAGASA
jgi:voltage-gated potassium channel